MYSVMRYRGAKKFKLDDDLEVTDMFSGTAKKPLKADWDSGSWRYVGNKLSRPESYLESRVGDLWDTVWSDVCQIASRLKPYTGHWLRDRVNRAVDQVVEFVDGVPCARWHNGGNLTELSRDQLYVDPSGVLRKTDVAPRGVRHSWGSAVRRKQNLASNEVVVDGVKFSLLSNEYKRKIAPEVFETVVSKVWMKHSEEEYTYTEGYWERQFGAHMVYNHLTMQNSTQTGWHTVWKQRSVLRTRIKIVTASKKDIRDYKLNQPILGKSQGE